MASASGDGEPVSSRAAARAAIAATGSCNHGLTFAGEKRRRRQRRPVTTTATGDEHNDKGDAGEVLRGWRVVIHGGA